MLDLFDQQENRFSSRAKLVIPVGNKARAPGAELLDLALVQTIAQRSPKDLRQCTTTCQNVAICAQPGGISAYSEAMVGTRPLSCSLWTTLRRSGVK
jgi:hypothetical protein